MDVLDPDSVDEGFGTTHPSQRNQLHQLSTLKIEKSKTKGQILPLIEFFLLT
jgi:hypothetical protein